MKILEGWKQIADALNYSERQTLRFYQKVRHRLSLKNYLGSGHRMKMDHEDIAEFKRLIVSDSVTFPRRNSEMSENGVICQCKLFDR